MAMQTMENDLRDLLVRAATIDELLSDDFSTLPGQKAGADIAAKRLAAWSKSCASGDWLLFGRRLKRDDIVIDEALARFASVRRSISAATPKWVEHAVWIAAALGKANKGPLPTAPRFTPTPRAFEHLLFPVVDQAETRLWNSVERLVADNLSASARAHLRQLLLDDLSSLCAPAIYARFVKARGAATEHTDSADGKSSNAAPVYEQFIAEMNAKGFQHLFDEKPVLLRLMASTTQQWLETSREFVTRLYTDLPAIRQDLTRSKTASLIDRIEGHLSDPHHGGRSVLIVQFQDGSRVLYKPKNF